MLSEDVRNELAAIAPDRRCDALAELSALFHTAGTLHLHGRSRIAFHLDLAGPAAARRAFSLLRMLGVESEIRTYRRPAFDRSTRYQLHVGDEEAALACLREAGVVDRGGRPLSHPPRRVAGRGCCRAAYLRGAVLGGGSVSGPRAPHLEIRFPEGDGATFLARAVSAEGVVLRTRVRGSTAIAYARGAESIADALALAGASDAALAVDEHAVIGAARAAANRLANADHANLVRTSRAAHAQLEALRQLGQTGGLDRLPEALREVAELRLRLPSAPLRELASKARPPLSHATVRRRLAAIVDLASEQGGMGAGMRPVRPGSGG